MDTKQYIATREHNAKIVRRCLETHSTDFSDIIFWEGVKGKELSFDTLASKWADVLGCSAVGAIPTIAKTGADGFAFFERDRNTPHGVETKVAGITQDKLALGSQGGLYYSNNLENWNSKALLTSHISGKFSSIMTNETRATKNRATFLVTFDRTENKVICAHYMPGEIVLDLLESKKNNASITIKLGAFRNHGYEFETQWNTEGYDKWTCRMVEQTRKNGRFIL